MSAHAAGVMRQLAGRLCEVARVLDVPIRSAEAPHVLSAVVERVRRTGDAAEAWLLWTALAGCFPIRDEAVELHRDLRLAATTDDAVAAALDRTRNAAGRRGRWQAGYRIQVGGVVADVDFCAHNEHNTGIQRLVRETTARWEESGADVEYVGWDSAGFAMCDLADAERDRVVRWSDGDRDRAPLRDRPDSVMVVPWRSRVVLLEVPRAEICPALVTLAASSGNAVDVVGYDAIPLVSADLVSRAESNRFGMYLAIVKHADRVFAISSAAAAEFDGFAAAARVQGLPGPSVRAIPLPVDVPVMSVRRAVVDPPYLLCVGSHDRRKNHEAIIEAGRILGREGHRPRIVFVGRGSAAAMRRFDAEAKAARSDGVDVVARSSVDDGELARLYSGARATLFPSLHEGFGLPVAESLAYGAPALTSDYGSTREVAAGGGCLLVDPRDLIALADGMRRLLEDDDMLARLEAEIASRPHRGWDDYARELAAGLRIEGGA